MKTNTAVKRANKFPIRIELGSDLIPLVNKEKGANLLDVIATKRNAGLIIPRINIVDNVQLDTDEYCIKLNGVVTGRYKIKPDSFLCINPGGFEYGISGEETKDPVFELPALWISADDIEKAEKAGYTVCDFPGIITTHLTEICKQRAPELLNLQMTKEMLDDCGEYHPFVVEEALKCLSVPEIQRVLKNLLKENVSIHSLYIILESLAEFSPTSKDIRFLTERARQALADQICDQYADQNRTIHVLTLEPSLEQKISDSGAKNSSGELISCLEHFFYNAWIMSLREAVNAAYDKGHSPVILCSGSARYLVRDAVVREFPEVAVLSVNEIDKNYSVELIGLIEAETELVNKGEPINERDILLLLEKIYNETHECGILNYRLEGNDHLDYVSQKLGVSPLQAVLFSFFMSRSEDNRINFRDLASSANCSEFTIVKYKNEFDELEKKGLIRCSKTDSGISYRIPYEVVDSLIKNNGYTPAKTEGLSVEKFFTALQRLFEERNNDELSFVNLSSKLLALIKVNMHLQFCKNLISYNLTEKDMTLLVCFCHLAGNYNDDDIRIPDFSFLYDDKSEFQIIKREFYNDTHLLIENKLIEHCNEINIRNSDLWRLSDRAKQELLEELIVKEKDNRKNLVLFENIKPKKMFYNHRETTAINSLTSLLQEENYQRILGRFESKGMRKGFTCLFSGGPGTGKSETVYQIARETKRNIMAVDISETRSLWFGESERKIKEIFNTYRKAVENSKIAPILLFNEADAVINKRNSSESFVSQTENRIQNILLQEMENLSGIMIATSNLTENMDSAFERRFLYKITFDRPGIESRKGIWNVLVPDLPEDKVIELSGRFDLSGGQIENIARKIEVNAILSGDGFVTETLVQYCKDEIENGFNSSKKIGFAKY